jgi:hypothetical protein
MSRPRLARLHFLSIALIYHLLLAVKNAQAYHQKIAVTRQWWPSLRLRNADPTTGEKTK